LAKCAKGFVIGCVNEIRMEVIVLNFRTPEVTIDCLDTLAEEWKRWPGFHVVLIDNASGDESVPKITKAIEEAGDWDAWLEFRPFEKNLGFAGGNNVVMRECIERADPPAYVLLLNSDTLVKPNCLETSVKVMDADPKIGAMSCMLLNGDETVQNVCRKFPRPDREAFRAMGLPWLLPKLFEWADLDDLSWDRRAGPRDVEWIGGAFLLARTEALAKAGVFDEDFFFYGEDTELCFRLWKSGYRVHFDPSSETVHLGGASSNSKKMRNRTKEILTWRARFGVQKKCYGSWASFLSRAVYACVFLGRWGLSIIRGGKKKNPEFTEEMWEGFRQVTGPLEP